jgi:hypothetical protein
MPIERRLFFLVAAGCVVLLGQMRDTRLDHTRQGAVSRYEELPLSFEVNQGQADPSVKFVSHTSGAAVFLTNTEVVLSLASQAAHKTAEPKIVRMQFIGANDRAPISGLDELPGKSNYFIGSDPHKWRTNISTYAKVQYQDVYPGVDLIYYGNPRQLEYDWVVSPGADPETIRLSFSGADHVDIDRQGDLVLHMPDGGDIRQHKPTVYQDLDNGRREVSASYVLDDSDQIAFHVAAYDRSRPLVIDPTLTYSTYISSFGAVAFATVVDSGGNAYIAGGTTSIFTTPGVVQPSFGGGDGTIAGSDFGPIDAFVTKINAAGSGAVYSTYLGGRGDDVIFGALAVDAGGNAYVAGFTDSTNFPVTPGAFQTALAIGQCSEDGTTRPCQDGFVTKLNSTGSALVYSTYLGGKQGDNTSDLAVDSAGNAYVAGQTDSDDFPITAGAFQRTRAHPQQFGGGADGFITKLNPSGTALVYSTYLGGDNDDGIASIAIDDSGNAYVTGETQSTNFPRTTGAFQSASGADVGTVVGGTPGGGGGPSGTDAFVTKINASGSALVWSTYLGGAGGDRAQGIAVDGSGNVYVAGTTQSTNFPTTAGAVQRAYGGGPGMDGGCGFVTDRCGDAFITKLNSSGSGLVYSTYLGGSAGDWAARIRVTSSGAAYVTGFTGSANFPTANTFQTSFGGATGDAFVANLSASGALVYSTYLGGANEDAGFGLAIDAAGNAYVTGYTLSSDFPTVTPIRGSTGFIDAFIAKLPAVAGSTTGGGGGGGGGGGDQTGGPPAGVSPFSVANNSGVSITSTGSGPLTQGYVRIQPGAGNTTPSGVAIFGFRTNNVLVSEAGVPASPLIQSGRIYAEVNGPVNTGLAIANPSGQDAIISFFFTDQNGTNFGSGTTTIPANRQIAGFLNQSPFNGGSSVSGTFTFNSNVPVGAIALRGLTNERSEFLITTLPVSSLSAAPLNNVAFFPHFADSGGWTTQVVLVNSTDTAMAGSVQFFQQGTTTAAAQPATVTIAGQSGSSFPYTIPARSSRKLQTSGQGASAGSVRVVPSANNNTPSGLAIFSFRNAGVTVSEAGVPASRTSSAFRLYAEGSGSLGQTGSIQTGIAITNPSANSVTVNFTLTTPSSGTATGSKLIPGNGQIALFVNELGNFPFAYQGVLRISTTSSSGVSVVGLRGHYNERSDFLITTTPAVDETSPATSAEQLFPHFADGGGYTTQFVLFSGAAGQSSSGNLLFVAQNGQPLNLLLR